MWDTEEKGDYPVHVLSQGCLWGSRRIQRSQGEELSVEVQGQAQVTE